MFMVDDHYQIRQKTSQYYAARMITQEWAQPGDGEHHQYLATSDVKDSEGHVLVTSYALQRPDGQWSLMLINKDHDNPHAVKISFRAGDTGNGKVFSGPVSVVTFGKAQYQWHPSRKKGYADPDDPPVKSTMNADQSTTYNLPAASLTVLRGQIAGTH
jgi:hypothetical protein